MGVAGGHVTTALTVVVLLLLLTPAQAQTTYAMSDNAQCDKSGFEVIATGSSVRVIGKRDGATGDRLTCYVRLTTSDRESQLRLTYQSVNINDCDVTLHVTAQGDPAVDTLTCGPLPTLTTKTSTDGNVVIRLDRRNVNDVDYNFVITVEAFKLGGSASPQYTTSDSNPVAVGLVAGVVGGVLGTLVLLAILGVCCYKRVKRAKERERERDYKENLAEIEGGGGYSNDVDQNGIIRNEEYHDSPRGKRKLLAGKRYTDDPRPNERSVDGPRSPVTPPAPPLPVSDMASSPSKKSAFDFDKPQLRKENGDAAAGKAAENKTPETPKSPILAALHNNPKFRATFQATEADAENRAQRISMYSTGGESQSSLASQASSQAPPPLPSIPRVPKSPASRRQNHASIRRAQRLSSGDDLPRSSESEDDPNIHVIRANPPPASPSEVVPIKTQDPHAAEPKKKFDTTHTLRPNRGKSPQTKKKEVGDAPKAVRPTDLESVTGRSVASSQGGMFKKANSLRKRSAKSPRLGRASRSSVGNALDETDARPTTPTSMRGFDDDDLEDYPPLKRTASRQSLYASRSSLYNRRGRRERNNSIGESLYSFAHDDIDAYRYGQDSAYEDVIPRRMSRRSFRSLGDLEYAMRETATQTLRETATQTGKGQAFVSGSKLRASKKKSGSSKSLGAAIALSAADSETKETKKSGKDAGTSTGGTPKSVRKKAASMDNLDAAKGKGDKPKRKKSVTKTTGTDAGGDTAAEIIAGNTGLPEASAEAAKPPKPKPKPKPRPLPRKSQSNPAFAGGEEEGEGEEAADNAANGHGGAPVQQTVAPTTAPSMVAPQPGMMPMMAAPYIMTPQGLVLAQPYPHMQAMYPGAQAPQQAAANPQASSAYPPQAPAASGGGTGRPSRTNWDLLCDLTGGQQAGQPSDIASVSGSVFSSAIPPYSQGYAGPGNYGGNAYPSSIPAYAQMSAALSDHGSYSYEAGGNKPSHSPQSSSSSRGTPPMASSTPPPSNSAKKASWEALQEATDTRYRLTYGSKSQASGGTESIV